MTRTADKKSWNIIREKVRERDGHRCIVCGRTEHIQVHHLISREIKELWLDMNNLICLCPSHHKFSHHELSFHGNSMLAAIWLQKNRPSTWQWLQKQYEKYEQHEQHEQHEKYEKGF